MFGRIKRLGRKKPDIHRSMGTAEASEAVKKLIHMAGLRMAITTAKRHKKKHSHLAAELARLEQEPGL